MAARLTEKEALALGLIKPEDAETKSLPESRARPKASIRFLVAMGIILGWLSGFYMGFLFR